MQYALGLGSNMGNRLEKLQFAIDSLNSEADVAVLRLSNIYETEYVGHGNQDAFLNACCIIETNKSPSQLLVTSKNIEKSAGRLPDTHMQPRVLDIDLLLMGQGYYSDESLQIPHPRMSSRQFVLKPLSEIAGEWKIFDSQLTVDEICISEDDAKVQLQTELNLVLNNTIREAE
jgi:2-amino-4-hydroxy-6-hydroxymethyldihydropteridine diphosphokinase